MHFIRTRLYLPVFLLLLLTGLAGCRETPVSEASTQTTTTTGTTAVPSSSPLFRDLYVMDSLLFEQGYNRCDSNQVRTLTAEDFEFYHDQSGTIYSKEGFVQSMRGLCNLSYKPRRELVPGTLQVFPLYDNGELYAVLQMGDHRFYAKEEGKPEVLTSVAKFISFWLMEEDDWKLSRVFSYDHQASDEH